MFNNKYVVSCNNCRTEFKTEHSKVIKEFMKIHNGKCPCCGHGLSYVPLVANKLTPLPDMRSYPIYKREEDLDHPSTANYNRWERYNMIKCSEDCIPCCDYCIHCIHEFYKDIVGTGEPISCALHKDYDHQERTRSCGYCNDFSL